MIAARNRAFMPGSGWPSLAATVISRASLPNNFDFWASCRPLRCMMFLNWECPAMQSLSGIVGERKWGWKRGVTGRRPAKIKDLRVFSACWYCLLPACEAIVNHDFMRGCKDRPDFIVFREGSDGVRFVSKTSAGTGCGRG